MAKTISNILTISARSIRYALFFLLCGALFLPPYRAFGQFLDQGAIVGTVLDDSGLAIPRATVTIEDPDTAFILTTIANASGDYIFSPIKIGNYTITASAPNFETAVQKGIVLSLGQRLNISPRLKLGAVTVTVTVTGTPPLLQTEEGSVGQVMTSQQINSTPLNDRNAMYLAHLSAGVAPVVNSRGGATGDFSANGLRPEQNNFVLDGMDNNAESVDFLGQRSFVSNPPPDALAEFKVTTSDYSAEFGHSAGAVVSASIKSGTNAFHGALWEFWRNNILNAHDWVNPATPTGEYRQNQFGAALGGPILKNRLFFFGDLQSTRRVANLAQSAISVPTPLERQGNFSEMLNPAFLGGSKPQVLYEPQNNQTLMTCGGVQNVLCQNQIDSLAQKMLNLYPLPNANSGLGFNNYLYSLKQPSPSFQWDARTDWNASARDQAFVRFSYFNFRATNPGPLGPVLDGSCGGGTTCQSGTSINFSNNFVLSETHIFNPRLVNEFRFAYTYAHYDLVQLNHDHDISTEYGFGGVPYGPGYPDNGGLPNVAFTGGGAINNFGGHSFRPEKEKQNVYEIRDNVSWSRGRHSIRYGFSYQSIRTYTLEPPSSRPQYMYTGAQTASPGVSNTGSGIADFLTNNMSNGSIGPFTPTNMAQNYIAAYAQDDWRPFKNLAVNVGVRYDNFQPYKEMAGEQASFNATSVGISTGTGVIKYPAQYRNSINFNPAFLAVLAKDNIALTYDSNPRLVQQQKWNFAPRIGIAYTVDPKTVVRAGFGMFYQGQQSVGAAGILAFNYPFVFTDSFPAPSCTAGSKSCGNNGSSLESGFSSAIAQGLSTFFQTTSLVGQLPNPKTTYAMDYNLSFERAITNNIAATISYVGDGSRHLNTNQNNDASTVLLPSGSAQSFLPFPDFSSSSNINNAGISSYNGLQAKISKRTSHGLTLLATYTWAHAMDDATEANGDGIGGYRNSNLIPIRDEYANSGWDIRNRFTFTGEYLIPVGRGQTHLGNASRLVDAAIGSWSVNLTYQLQSGAPFTVGSSNITTVVGAGTHAFLKGDPFAPGGTPDPSNPSITCPTAVRTKAHWFNPCAFANPLPASLLTPFSLNRGNPTVAAPGYAYPTYITDMATANLFTGGPSDQIHGPGYQRMDMSLFRLFRAFREQYFEVRVDGFNMLNTPAYGQPSGNISQTGGLISSARIVQLDTPNARFFQLSGKYVF